MEVALFLSHFEQALDTKNRLVLPSAFRDPFLRAPEPRSVYLNIVRDAPGAHLELYMEEAFQKKAQKLVENAEFSVEARRLHDKFFWETHKCALDAQWRILLPPRWVQVAGLAGRKVWLVGCGATIKLCNPTVWEALNQEPDPVDGPPGEARGVAKS